MGNKIDITDLLKLRAALERVESQVQHILAKDKPDQWDEEFLSKVRDMAEEYLERIEETQGDHSP